MKQIFPSIYFDDAEIVLLRTQDTEHYRHRAGMLCGMPGSPRWVGILAATTNCDIG